LTLVGAALLTIVLAVLQSTALSATYDAGGGDATCRRIVMFGTDCFPVEGRVQRGGYHPSCHPAPSETCFPKGPRLFLSYSFSPGCFFMDCLSGAMMAWQECSKCSVTHMACPLFLTLRSSSRNFQPSFSLPYVKCGQHFSDRHN